MLHNEHLLQEIEQSETVGTVTYSLLLISLTFNIFIFCYIGDLLTEQVKSYAEITNNAN